MLWSCPNHLSTAQRVLCLDCTSTLRRSRKILAEEHGLLLAIIHKSFLSRFNVIMLLMRCSLCVDVRVRATFLLSFDCLRLQIPHHSLSYPSNLHCPLRCPSVAHTAITPMLHGSGHLVTYDPVVHDTEHEAEELQMCTRLACASFGKSDGQMMHHACE